MRSRSRLLMMLSSLSFHGLGIRLAQAGQNCLGVGIGLFTRGFCCIQRFLRVVPSMGVVMEIVVVDGEIALKIVLQWLDRGEFRPVADRLSVVICRSRYYERVLE